MMEHGDGAWRVEEQGGDVGGQNGVSEDTARGEDCGSEARRPLSGASHLLQPSFPCGCDVCKTASCEQL